MNKLLLVIAYLVFGCNQKTISLEDYLLKNVSISSEYELNSDLQLGKVTEPAGTWVNILKLENPKNFCLFYKTPFKKELGTFRISETCNAYSKIKIDLTGIEAFQIVNSQQQIAFEYIKGGKKHKLYLPDYNIELKGNHYKRYDSPVGVTRITGLKIGWPSVTPRNIGSPQDDYREGTAKICHKVTDECKDKIKNICSQCKYGSYEVVDHLCPQGSTKYCGVSKCGEKGQPACPRGVEVVGLKKKSCYEGSKAGFCQNGLKTFCDQNKILVCL